MLGTRTQNTLVMLLDQNCAMQLCTHYDITMIEHKHMEQAIRSCTISYHTLQRSQWLQPWGAALHAYIVYKHKNVSDPPPAANALATFTKPSSNLGTPIPNVLADRRHD
jgi:hypothetical protein